MISKDNAPMLLGMAAIVVTLGIGTCSTNGRINDTNRRMDNGFNNLQQRMDDSFDNVNRRIDDGFDNVNRRIDDTNQRIDEVQSDVREIRTMLFEILKNLNPAN